MTTGSAHPVGAADPAPLRPPGEQQRRLGRAPRTTVLYLLPALLIYGLFMAVPLLLSMRLAFFEWDGVGVRTYVGWENFVQLFTQPPWSDRLWGAFRNNAMFFAMVTVLQNVPAFFLAWLLHFPLKGRRFFRNLFFLPVTMSVVIVGLLARLFLNPLNGAFNRLMEVLGLDALSRPWVGEESTALLVVAAFAAWQYLGIALVLFLSGFENVDAELVEAARIDGASHWRVLRHIQLPLLAPIIGIVMVLTFIGNFTAFELVFAMQGTNAGPNFATDIFGTFFYRVSFGAFGSANVQLGLGAAIAVCMFLLIAAAVVAWLVYDRYQLRRMG